jgi:hypothetical protein
LLIEGELYAENSLDHFYKIELISNSLIFNPLNLPLLQWDQRILKHGDLFLSYSNVLKEVRLHDAAGEIRYINKKGWNFGMYNIRKIQNQIYLFTEKGVFRWNEANEFEFYFPFQYATNMLIDSEKNQWVTSLSQGVYLIPDIAITTIGEYNEVEALHAKGDSLWIGHDQSSVVLLDSNWTAKTYYQFLIARTIFTDARDIQLSGLARNLAASMESAEVRSFIKAKAKTQFDGDYNFLLETTKELSINASSGARTFSDFITGLDRGLVTEKESEDLLTELSADYPLIQVAVPELNVGTVEEWDIQSHIPLVGYIPSNFQEGVAGSIIPAYDSEGNYYELDGAKEPDQLVVIISENERLITVDNNNNQGRLEAPYLDDECQMQRIYPFHKSTSHTYYFRSQHFSMMNELILCGGGGGGGTGGGGSGDTNTCSRENDSRKDYINKAMFKDYGTLRQVESWTAGKPEVRLIVTFAQPLVSSGFFFSGLSYAMGEHGWFERKWFKEWTVMKNFDDQIVQWDPENYGDRMYYTWIEEDPGGSISFNFNVSSTFHFLNNNIANVTANGAAQLNIGGNDDMIAGPIPVEYCDNTRGEGTEYRTPMIFWVNQQ